jgi:hypothetical protein
MSKSLSAMDFNERVLHELRGWALVIYEGGHESELIEGARLFAIGLISDDESQIDSAAALVNEAIAEAEAEAARRN